MNLCGDNGYVTRSFYQYCKKTNPATFLKNKIAHPCFSLRYANFKS